MKNTQYVEIHILRALILMQVSFLSSKFYTVKSRNEILILLKIKLSTLKKNLPKCTLESYMYKGVTSGLCQNWFKGTVPRDF